MKRIFIVTLMIVSMMMVACVERRNRVILEKFIPITEEDQCVVKAGGDRYVTTGNFDVALTDRYQLAFQMTNYISSSKSGSAGSSAAPIEGGEANNFYVKWAEMKYEWDPRPQPNGAQIKLTQDLWNKAKRTEIHGVVISPEGGQAAAVVDIFTEAQARDLLKTLKADDKTKPFDWIASPILVKIKVFGELSNGEDVETNTLTFNVVPNYGESLQQGSVYYMPSEGFGNFDSDDKNEVYEAQMSQYTAIKNECAFQSSVLNGCLAGQDDALSNCYAGDTAWQREIAEGEGMTYIPGYAAASVVEAIYNNYKKASSDGGYYVCCPASMPEEPEKPEEEQEGDGSNTAAGE
ncbi:hypothetical protein J5834_03605 [bacterium]|nr:hypothetical protein [bacterium]